jgi:membrane-associated protein
MFAGKGQVKMSYDNLIELIQHFGYAALFFALWLGIAGMPIPDEVVVMTGGAVTGTGVLLAVPAFFVTYLGVISGLTLGYVLGKYMGAPVLAKLTRKKKMARYIQQSESLISKYGNLALCFSYFIPVVRHVIPYLAGINKMTFRRYACYSFTTGFVWTLIFFWLGRSVGSHAEQIGNLIYHYGISLLWLILALAAVYFIVKYLRNKTQNREKL